MDDLYRIFIDRFFRRADVYREGGAGDPVAVVLPRWSLHAFASRPALMESGFCPFDAAGEPQGSFLGLPIVGVGDDIEFLGPEDVRLQGRKVRIRTGPWPWSSVKCGLENLSGR